MLDILCEYKEHVPSEILFKQNCVWDRSNYLADNQLVLQCCQCQLAQDPAHVPQ